MLKKWLAIGGALVVIGVVAWFGRDAYATARIGTAYVAKQTCSCLFVARRSADSCATDYNAADIRQLTVEPAASSVTVSALGGLVSTRAEFGEGYGCRPAN